MKRLIREVGISTEEYDIKINGYLRELYLEDGTSIGYTIDTRYASVSIYDFLSIDIKEV